MIFPSFMTLASLPNIGAYFLSHQFKTKDVFFKKKKIYGPFLWMGFNFLKAIRATSRRQFTFYH